MVLLSISPFQEENCIVCLACGGISVGWPVATRAPVTHARSLEAFAFEFRVFFARFIPRWFRNGWVTCSKFEFPGCVSAIEAWSECRSHAACAQRFGADFVRFFVRRRKWSDKGLQCYCLEHVRVKVYWQLRFVYGKVKENNKVAVVLVCDDATLQITIILMRLQTKTLVFQSCRIKSFRYLNYGLYYIIICETTKLVS